ncbi:IucA/IucC family protein [Agrobacterium larrymoorei]|uniref:IucA/IucC family siderophore biosynthesis protein n=1 Tax=Agrobacterium larrymoorei TaxID=160699 RepID=A0A4D7DQJ4_9HYPH|nr:IucA/IucC family protein [Agrobacterium larrymoorei]QCI99643.1 IucA/IucC family siderophore biosynthesis protein [Agrobacterium larrymoorei]QYA09926.1 IucA/IucC family siderophore biosynthesis protein [Agrobacterium larrymoorei]
MHAHKAATLALRSLLNCVVREYADRSVWSQEAAKQKLTLNFPNNGGSLKVPVVYRSITGHNLFAEPVVLNDDSGTNTVSAEDAISVIIERIEANSSDEGREDLLKRAHSSCLLIEAALANRESDLEALIDDHVSFIAAEQGLIAGHGIHPCPKSREGMTEEEGRRYSPEFAASFRLRWFAVARDIYHSGHSEGSPSSEDWLEAVEGEALSALRANLPNGDFAFLPVHPWQADAMLKGVEVASLVASGKIVDCGEAGAPWFPTSSVRTLYRSDAPFMLKLSLGIGITNSVRINLARELLRGDDMYRFRSNKLGQELTKDYPGFNLMPDPAYIGVAPNGDVIDGLSVSMRENPFHGAHFNRNVTLLAALCEHLPERGSRVGALIRKHARIENRDVGAVAIDWFERFLEVFVKPVFALYLRHGIATEAHQQNVLLEIEDGYPVSAFYRDNQGFFHHERAHAALHAAIPGIGERSESVFGEEAVDERVLYYAFINSTLGMIGALGREGFVSEETLISILRDALISLDAREGGQSVLVGKTLAPTLQCKANLRTRLAQMDELVGPLETQSVYLEIDNPLFQQVQARAHG